MPPDEADSLKRPRLTIICGVRSMLDELLDGLVPEVEAWLADLDVLGPAMAMMKVSKLA